MKILTLNFLTCARKACKPLPTSFPLHPKDATLEIVETDLNLVFLQNILPRLDWPALMSLVTELGLSVPGGRAELPEAQELTLNGGRNAEKGEGVKVGDGLAGEGMDIDTVGETEGGETNVEDIKEGEGDEPTQLAKEMHTLLLETTIQSGSLVCAACGHEYAVKEGIANFLLPSHLV